MFSAIPKQSVVNKSNSNSFAVLVLSIRNTWSQTCYNPLRRSCCSKSSFTAGFLEAPVFINKTWPNVTPNTVYQLWSPHRMCSWVSDKFYGHCKLFKTTLNMSAKRKASAIIQHHKVSPVILVSCGYLWQLFLMGKYKEVPACRFNHFPPHGITAVPTKFVCPAERPTLTAGESAVWNTRETCKEHLACCRSKRRGKVDIIICSNSILSNLKSSFHRICAN